VAARYGCVIFWNRSEVSVSSKKACCQAWGGADLNTGVGIGLEKKQDDDVFTHGEIETTPPGYIGSKDTFCVGFSKDFGAAVLLTINGDGEN